MTPQETQLLSHLRKNSRLSLASLSQDLAMPVSTIYDKVKQFKKENLITKHTTLIDFSKLGFHHRSKLALKVAPQQKKELLLFLQNHASVNSIYEIDSSFDFFIDLVHKSIKEYLAFLDGLKETFEIIDLKEFQILSDIEREKFCPI